MRGHISGAAIAAIVFGRPSAATLPDDQIRRPSLRDQGPAAALGQALEQRVGALSLPLPPGEQCTQRVDVDVTAGKKQASLSLRTRKPRRDQGQRLDQAQVPGTGAVSGAVSRRRAGGFPSDRRTPPR